METDGVKKRFGVFGISVLEVIAYFFVCAAHVGLVLLQKQIVHNNNVPKDVALPRDDILDRIFFLSFNPLVQRVIGGAKWFLAGALLYMVAWVVIVMIVNAFDDIVIGETFMHPSSFSKSSYWVAIMARIFLRIAGGIFLVAISLVFLQVLSPIYARMGSGGNVLLKGVGQLIGAQLLYLYLSTIFLRFIFLRRRVF